MAMQARAEATRRRIIDSAIELFDELGYGETGLNDVLNRAGISKGAFYYHFDSKEAVAAAIIEDHRHRIANAVLAQSDPSAPALESVIRSTFTATTMLGEDKTARIGNQLLQALGQVSSVAAKVYGELTADFIGWLSTAIEGAGMRDDADAVEAAEAMWGSLLGCNLLTSAMAGDCYRRLVSAWRTVLRATLDDQVLEHYLVVLDRFADQYQGVGRAAS